MELQNRNVGMYKNYYMQEWVMFIYFYFLKLNDALVSCEGEKQFTKLTAG